MLSLRVPDGIRQVPPQGFGQGGLGKEPTPGDPGWVVYGRAELLRAQRGLVLDAV